MENRFSTENLKVGDKVMVNCSDGWSNITYVGTVTKKTPTGMVDVTYSNGACRRFRESGSTYEKKERYSRGGTHLSEYTEEKELEMIKEKETRVMKNWLSKFEWGKLDHDELQTVVELVQGLKNS